MRRKVTAILLSVMVSVMVLAGVALSTNSAQAQPQANNTICLPAVCVDATVTLPGVTVTLPRRTVTVLKPVTVTAPGATVRVTISPPPVVKTILQQRTVAVPGPVRTIVQPGLQGPTTTATVVVSKEVIHNGTAPPVTREVRTTMSGQAQTGQTATVHATVTPSKEVKTVKLPGTTKKIPVPVAVGLGLLGLLALIGLGLLLLWGGFILGYRSADRSNNNFLRALRDSMRRPGKHEMSH